MNKVNENVISIKTSSGEEVIGKYVRTDGNIMWLRSPLKVDRMMSDGGLFYTTRAWFMAQFESCEEAIIGIHTDKIIAQHIPGEAAIKQYHSTVEYLCSPSTSEMADSDEDQMANMSGGSQIH
jgi:hypothetical protein